MDEREGNRGEGLGTAIFAAPAPIERLLSTDELLAAAKARAADPSILSDRSPFFFRALISNDKLDAYYSRMHESSLKNYTADAQAGVSFQNSHVTRQLGFGRSLDAQFLDGRGGGKGKRVEADFFTIPGMKLNDVSTDDFIAGVQAGIIKDVSIGFYGGTMECSVCKRDIWDWRCPHIPGVEYDVLDKEGKPTGERVLAMYWVKDARLAEVSAVYDGATPDAAILKAQFESDAGRLRPEVARLLETRYRAVGLRLVGAPAPHLVGQAPTKQKERTMPDGDEQRSVAATPPNPQLAIDATLGAEVRTLLAGLGHADEPLVAIKRLHGEVERLAPLADDGTKYRATLVQRALDEGVRAFGADAFKVEAQRVALERMPLDILESNIAMWTLTGDQRHPAGRLSEDGEPEPIAEVTPLRRVPRRVSDAAFRVG